MPRPGQRRLPDSDQWTLVALPIDGAAEAARPPRHSLGVAARFKWLAVYEKQNNGKWMMVADIWNDEPTSSRTRDYCESGLLVARSRSIET
jgi:hypothetical protein